MKDISESQMKKVAWIVARGAFSNCGHNFNSIKRIFVDREIADSFTAAFLE
jgi:acyl-CoA reductase-like NAD-dependent aldehyde dehydrogenase